MGFSSVPPDSTLEYLAQYPPQPPGAILPLFAQLGIVDSRLQAKSASATYDSIFARPLAK